MITGLTTIRIFVMGLAMLDVSQDGKELAIMMPDDHGHFPVLLYPCAASSTTGCSAGVAGAVAQDLENPVNLIGGFLVPVPNDVQPASFGAYRLNNSSVALASPQGDPHASAKRQRRHHWWSGWWFHMRGEVPSMTDATDAADLFWLPSLGEMSNCTVDIAPADAPNFLSKGVETSYLWLKSGEWKSVRVVSVGSISEDVAGGCTGVGAQLTYAPASRFTPEFSPWYKTFSAPHQAAADIIEIDTAIQDGSGIVVTPKGGTPVTILPDFSISPEILIGNLSPLPHSNRACDISGIGHFNAYYQLLPKCQPLLPRFGRLNARVAKQDLRQRCSQLPAATRAVSGDCNAAGGQARPICYVPTN